MSLVKKLLTVFVLSCFFSAVAQSDQAIVQAGDDNADNDEENEENKTAAHVV